MPSRYAERKREYQEQKQAEAEARAAEREETEREWRTNTLEPGMREVNAAHHARADAAVKAAGGDKFAVDWSPLSRQLRAETMALYATDPLGRWSRRLVGDEEASERREAAPTARSQRETVSKADRVRQYLSQHPDAKNAEVAAAVGCSSARVREVRVA